MVRVSVLLVAVVVASVAVVALASKPVDRAGTKHWKDDLADDDDSSETVSLSAKRCSPKKLLARATSFINNDMFERLDKLFAPNAHRFDNGAPAAFNNNKPLTGAQWKCIKERVAGDPLMIRTVTLTGADDRHAAISADLTFGDNVKVSFGAFWDFDHNCKVAAEHLYWNPISAGGAEFVELAGPCLNAAE